jgi:hypothetical protein
MKRSEKEHAGEARMEGIFYYFPSLDCMATY